MSIETLIDTTKPNVARIYDYGHGGTHNFPVDRAVAKKMEQAMPFAFQSINLNRWFVEYAGRTMAKAGMTQFLDLGAGLPTEGALNTAVPASSKILYVDNDADTVTYSQYILREELGAPANIRYIQGRIEDIDPILTEAQQFFDAATPTAFCLIGVTWFVDDESLQRTFRRLYEWAAPGSMLAVSGGEPARDNLSEDPAIRSYQQRTETQLYMRPVVDLVQCIGPWQPVDDGLKPFETYAEAELRTRLVSLDFRGKVGYAGFFQRRA